MRDPRRIAPGAARRRWPGAQCTSARRPRSGAAGRPAPWPRSGSVQRGHSNRRPCARGRRRGNSACGAASCAAGQGSMPPLHQSSDGRALHGRRRPSHGRTRQRHTSRGLLTARRTSKPTAPVDSNGWRKHCATGVITSMGGGMATSVGMHPSAPAHERARPWHHGKQTCTCRTPNRPRVLYTVRHNRHPV